MVFALADFVLENGEYWNNRFAFPEIYPSPIWDLAIIHAIKEANKGKTVDAIFVFDYAPPGMTFEQLKVVDTILMTALFPVRKIYKNETAKEETI